MSDYKMAYMQFFPGDFLNGILYLNNEEVGMYIKMICASWETQTIPKKRVPFLIQKEWDELSEELKSKFIDYGDSVVNKRVNKDLKQMIDFNKSELFILFCLAMPTLFFCFYPDPLINEIEVSISDLIEMYNFRLASKF